MTEIIQPIPARIKNVAIGGHVAGTEDIIDDTLGKTQQTINQEVDNKIETLTRQDIEVVSVLPAVGDADPKKIYRVTGTTSYTDYMLNPAGTAFSQLATFSFPGIDDEPTAGSDNLVKSGGIVSFVPPSTLDTIGFNSLNNVVYSVDGDGYYDKNGVLRSTSTYKHSTPIQIQKGWYIIKAGGYSGNVAILSKTNAEGSVHELLVQDVNLASEYKEHYYIFYAPEQMYVCVSYRSALGAAATIKKANVISSVFNKLLEQENGILTAVNDALEQLDKDSYIKTDTVLDVESTLDNVYLKQTGDLQESTGWSVNIIEIPEDSKKLYISGVVRAGASTTYNFYSSDEFSASTLVKAGIIASQTTDDSLYVEVPEGATHVGVTCWRTYNPSIYTCVPIVQKVNELDEEIKNLQPTNNNRYAYSYDGSILLVAYNDGSGYETVYQFNKCMNNNLFTFAKVGYREVNRTFPVATDIMTDPSIVILNQTSSDNIGPFLMTTGGWTGGNHHYPDESTTPNYKTAKTDEYHCYADGIELEENTDGTCNVITIEVINSIYDPAFPPSEGDEILSTLLCKEYASYSIVKNNIEVSISHKFVSTTENGIKTYYGMQSMFQGETALLTPNGQYTAWHTLDGNVNFTKGDYPHFNRFIEKSDVGYQAAFLRPDFGIGKHTLLANSDIIFRHSGTKSYHEQISNHYASVADKVIQWRGTYTFFKTAAVDDSGELLVYQGSIGCEDTIFISTSQAFSGFVPIPHEHALKDFDVYENYGFVNEDGTTNFELGGNGLYVSSQGAASMIIIFK